MIGLSNCQITDCPITNWVTASSQLVKNTWSLNQSHSRKVQYLRLKAKSQFCHWDAQLGIKGTWYFNENGWGDRYCTFALLTINCLAPKPPIGRISNDVLSSNDLPWLLASGVKCKKTIYSLNLIAWYLIVDNYQEAFHTRAGQKAGQ